jgi:drug/metabolite transporter (DMT)-like permease
MSWWSSFRRLITVAAAWHVLPLAGTVLALVDAVDTSRDGLLFVLFMVFTTLSAVIAIVLASIIAHFRPRRPWLWGHVAGITGIACTMMTIYVGLSVLASSL